MGPRSLYRFVDSNLGAPTDLRLMLAIGAVPLAATALLGPKGATAFLVWTFAGALTLVWYALVGWRYYHVVAKPADRRYDRKGKYALPPEYAATESATAAHARRKRRKP